MSSKTRAAKPVAVQEKIKHPSSRVAAQCLRKVHRKDKLANLANKAKAKTTTRLEFYSFIHARVPPEPSALTVAGLHSIMRAWVDRHGPEIEAEQAARRKGRPKSTREMKLEELALRDRENYKTGIEVPDLTDDETLARFRRWDVKSLGYAHLLRFVRISSLRPDTAVFSRAPTATPVGHAADLEEMERPTRSSIMEDLVPHLINTDDQMDEA